MPIVVSADAYLERNWVYHGPRMFESILKQELKLTGSGRNPAAEQAILKQLQDRAADLGKSNYATGVLENLAPAPGMFKFIAEIANEACYLSLFEPVVMSRLFPGLSGTNWNQSSFNAIYNRIIGRDPSQTEKNLLMTLTSGIPPNQHKQAAAVCAAVLSSLEANNAR